jgi:DNA-binding response OmpR family regulator
MGTTRKVQKILLVDDDRALTVFLEKYLKDNGYEVKALTEAAEGLEYAITRSPDLIILDVMMPIINGFNFCRLLKQEKNRKNIPVILLTARDQMKDIEIGFEVGAEAYLTKPVNTAELIKTIKVLESVES